MLELLFNKHNHRLKLLLLLKVVIKVRLNSLFIFQVIVFFIV